MSWNRWFRKRTGDFQHLFEAILFLVLAQTCLGEEPDPKDDGRADRLRANVGDKVRGMADRFDRFFGDERIDEESQDTTLRLSPAVKWENGEGTDPSMRLRLNIKLPRLEERWHVFMERNDNDVEFIDEHRETVTEAERDGDRESRTLFGIRYSPLLNRLSLLSFSGGGRFRDGGVHPYVRVRYRIRKKFSTWSAELVQSTFYFSNEGIGESTRATFDRNFGERSVFTTTSRVIWSQTSQGLDLEQYVSLRRFVGVGKAIEFSVGVEGYTRPSMSVDVYVGEVAYRQEIHNDWIFGEIRTQARFPEDRGHHFVPVVRTSLAFVF